MQRRIIWKRQLPPPSALQMNLSKRWGEAKNMLVFIWALENYASSNLDSAMFAPSKQQIVLSSPPRAVADAAIWIVAE